MAMQLTGGQGSPGSFVAYTGNHYDGLIPQDGARGRDGSGGYFSGLRKHAQSPTTFGLHWGVYKCFVQFLLCRNLVVKPVRARDALTRNHL